MNKIIVMLASAAVALSLAGFFGFRAASYDWAGRTAYSYDWAGDVTGGSWDWAAPDAGSPVPGDA